MIKDKIKLKHLRKIVDKMKELPGDTDITFEFLLVACFPTIWNSIQETMNKKYTEGYIQGLEDGKKTGLLDNENKD